MSKKLFDWFGRSPWLILTTDTWANNNGHQPPLGEGDCRHAHYACAKAALAKKAALKPNGLDFHHHPSLHLPSDRDGHRRSCVCNKQVVGLKHVLSLSYYSWHPESTLDQFIEFRKQIIVPILPVSDIH